MFSIAFRELVGSVLLRPPSVRTTSTYILQQFDQGSTGAGLAMAMVAMTAALVSVATARRFAATDARAGRVASPTRNNGHGKVMDAVS